MQQWNIDSNIEDLRHKTERAFNSYKKAEDQFYENLKLWLLSAPLLQDEDPEIVDEICTKVRERIQSGEKIGKITDLIGLITRKKVMQVQRKRGREFDPNLVDKLHIATPQGKLQEELDEECMKKLSPIHRLLISLTRRGMSKTTIAKLLFVTPARVTQYFDQAKKEIHKLGGGNL